MNTQNVYPLLLTLITLVWNLTTWAQSIAFSFDDGPVMATQAGMSAAARNTAILKQLADANVKTVLFLTLQDSRVARLNLVRQWGVEGHSIGNHTITHPNFHNPKITLSDYQREVEQCDSVISAMPGYTKLFRFTFLKEGNTIEKRDGFRRFLKTIHYRPAPVSIDASDWYYNARLLDWLKKNPGRDLTPYRDAYLSHLWSRAIFYDSVSQVVLGRSVKHVLLLHHNQINALFLKDIIAMFRTNGWNIIDPGTAFSDSVYSIEPNILPAGDSILLQIAKAKGEKSLRYPGEDEVYEKPILDKLGL